MNVFSKEKTRLLDRTYAARIEGGETNEEANFRTGAGAGAHGVRYGVRPLGDTYSCNRSLTFSGTTANCSVKIDAESSSTKIDCTVKLMRSGTAIATWPLTGTGSATLTKTMGCTSGQTYTLQITGTCGADRINEYVSNTCP